MGNLDNSLLTTIKLLGLILKDPMELNMVLSINHSTTRIKVKGKFQYGSKFGNKKPFYPNPALGVLGTSPH